MNSSKQKLVWNAIPTLKSNCNKPNSDNDKEFSNQLLGENTLKLDVTELQNCLPETIQETVHNRNCEDEAIKEPSPKRKRCIIPPSNPTPRTKKRLSAYKRLIQKYKNRYFNLKQAKNKKAKLSLSHLLNQLPGLSSTSLSFIKCQIEMCQKRKRGMRYNEKMKRLALNIYFHGPKCYRLLEKLLYLPSVRVLQRWLKNVDITPGFSSTHLNNLSLIAKHFNEENKYCVLSFDEMSLRNHLSYNASQDFVKGFENFGEEQSDNLANYALVFMLRGIAQNWKIPIGYFFPSKSTPSNKLKLLLFKAIDLVNEIGLKVKVVVCDQGSNNQSLYRLLGITNECPYIMHNNEQIHFLYDVPHLIKSLRNNFHKYGFTINENKILWTYVQQVYEKDKTQPIRAMPKLTDNHVYLPPFSKMKVKYAAQIFSNMVASLICTNISCGTLPQVAYHTADFLLQIDRIFDCLNSSCFVAKNEYLSAISDKSIHMKFFPKCLQYLNSCIVNSKRQPPCVSGLSLSIRSVMNIWNDLHSNCQITELRTRRLNQDGLENLFSIIRQNNGCNTNPSCVQFENSMKHISIGNIFKITDKTSNCEQDIDYIINCISKNDNDIIRKRLPIKESVKATIEFENLPINCDIVEENALYYIAGWMAKKLQNFHNCEICKFINENPTVDEQQQLFIMFRSKNQFLSDFGKLTVPTNEFVNFIKSCEALFINNIDSLLHKQGVHKLLLDILIFNLDVKKITTCSEQVVNEILSYFVRIRIYWTVKYYNRKIVETKKDYNSLRKLRTLNHT